MATTENRLLFMVSASQRSELEATFAFNRGPALQAYVQQLKASDSRRSTPIPPKQPSS